MAATRFPPSPGTSPKGAMPATVQKRREFLRQTDDDSGPMPIEHFIYRRDRYRSSSTQFPFPLPMRTENLPPYLQNQFTPSPTVRQEILQVLREHHIAVNNIGLFGQSKPSYPNGGDKVVPALHVDVDAAQGDSLERWSAARRDISAILERNGYSNLHVEIQDSQRFYQPSLYAIPPTHAAIRIYKAARNELITQIFSTIEPVWEMLSLFEVGRTANVRQPTVVLMVEPLAIYDWKILISSLEAVLDRYREGLPKLSVEIVPGAARPNPQSASKEKEQGMPGLSFLDDFRTHPRHGTSIGVQGERGGGTLGGFFKMVSPNKTHIGFLTNSHVVAPPASAPYPERLEYDAIGLSYRGSDSRGTKIHYFAVNDVQASIADGLDQIRAKKDKIRAIGNEETKRRERGQADEESQSRSQDRILSEERDIKVFEEDVAKAKDMPQPYGRTILASGRALTSKRMTLDYAFVETPAFGNCGLPDPSLFRYVRVRPSDLGMGNPLPLSPRSRSFSSIKPGQWYFKVGRTTDLTCGICNGIEAWVKPSNLHTLFGPKGEVKEVRRAGRILETDQEGRLVYDENGKPKETPGFSGYYYSSEWVIIRGTIDSTSMQTQQEFCAPGDSGSLIVDRDGAVAGLLWGELTGFCGPMDIRRQYVGAGLVTSIVDVKAAMKTALGWPADANVDVLKLP